MFKVGDKVRVNATYNSRRLTVGEIRTVVRADTKFGMYKDTIRVNGRQGRYYTDHPTYMFTLATKKDVPFYAICLKNYFGKADGFIEVTKMNKDFSLDKYKVLRNHKKATIFYTKQEAQAWLMAREIEHKNEVEFPVFIRKVWA